MFITDGPYSSLLETVKCLSSCKGQPLQFRGLTSRQVVHLCIMHYRPDA